MIFLADMLRNWSNNELSHAYANVRPGSDYAKAIITELCRRAKENNPA